MNKFGLVLTLCLGLAFSPLCALESTSQKNAHHAQNTSLSQADAAFLFTANANNLNVVALSDEEMGVAAGEFWPILMGLGLSFLSYLNAPAPNDPIYSGKPPF